MWNEEDVQEAEVNWWRNVATKPTNFKPDHNLKWSPQEFSFCLPNIHPHYLMTGVQEFFVPETYTLITWWQVHKNLLFPRRTLSSRDDRSTRIFCSQEVHRHQLMTGPQEFLVWEGPRSSPDDRYTRIIGSQEVHRHYMMTASQEFLVPQHPPTSCDDRWTNFICSTLIAWWQVHKNFVS